MQKEAVADELEHEIDQLRKDLQIQITQEQKRLTRQSQIELDKKQTEIEQQLKDIEKAEVMKQEERLAERVRGCTYTEELAKLRQSLQESLTATVEREKARLMSLKDTSKAPALRQEVRAILEQCSTAETELIRIKRIKDTEASAMRAELKAKRAEADERLTIQIAELRHDKEKLLQAKLKQDASNTGDLDSQLAKLKQEYESRYNYEKSKATTEYEAEYSLLLKQVTEERKELLSRITEEKKARQNLLIKDNHIMGEIETRQQKLALQRESDSMQDAEKQVRTMKRLKQEYDADVASLRHFTTPIKLGHDNLIEALGELKAEYSDLKAILAERTDELRKIKGEVRRMNAEIHSLESAPPKPTEFTEVLESREDSRLARLEAEIGELKQMLRTNSNKVVRPSTAPRAALNKWEQNLLAEREELNTMQLNIEQERQRFQRERKHFRMQPSVQKKVELSILKKVIDRQTSRIQERVNSIKAAERMVNLHRQELEDVEDMTQGPLQLSGEISPIELADCLEDTFNVKRPSTAKRYEPKPFK